MMQEDADLRERYERNDGWIFAETSPMKLKKQGKVLYLGRTAGIWYGKTGRTVFGRFGIMYKENITSLNQANRQIAILLNQNALLADRNHELEQKTQDLQRQLDWFKRQLFGQKSEKILPGPDEVPCLPGFEGSPKETPQAKGTETVREHERKKREVNGWGEIPPELPREEEIITDPAIFNPGPSEALN